MPRRMLRMVQHAMLTCVLCYYLFHSDVDILNMEDSISTRFKRLKARKSPKFVLFCGIKFYITPIQRRTIKLSMWFVRC